MFHVVFSGAGCNGSASRLQVAAELAAELKMFSGKKDKDD